MDFLGLLGAQEAHILRYESCRLIARRLPLDVRTEDALWPLTNTQIKTPRGLYYKNFEGPEQRVFSWLGSDIWHGKKQTSTPP